MKAVLLIFSFICCGLSFPAKIIKREWPTIIDEPVDQPGGFIHRMNNVAVETVRGNANFFTKCLAFTNLMALLALTLSWGLL
jgi:hypothetical protein